MRILAIETAGPTSGVALMDENRLLAEYCSDTPMAHAEELMVMVDRALREGGMVLRDLDALAVSIGPGSFTGLRVGVSTVKGLTAGNGIKVVAVPTLEALATNLVKAPGFICPMMDARKQEVYAALFSDREGGTLHRCMEDQVILPRDLADRISELLGGGKNEVVAFLGDGVPKYREVLQSALGKRAHFTEENLYVSRPSSVAFLGLQRLRRGEVVKTGILAPHYLRRPDAEVNWEKGIRPKKLVLGRTAGKSSQK